MSGRSRAQREVVEGSTDGEARIIINSPEDIQDELNRLRSAPAGRSPRSEPPPPGDQSMDVEPPAAAAPTPAPSETPIDVEALYPDDGAPAPAAAEPAVAFTGPDLTDGERMAVEVVLRDESGDSVISLKDFRRKVEVLLDAREDALKEKKGAIKAHLFTKCLPRVLENLVDDEDDD